MIIYVFIVLSVQFDFVWSTRYSRCILSLSLVLIKDYYLSLRPCLRVLVPLCCVHRDRRPDLTISGAPSPRFVLFVFFLVFICFLCLVSRGKRVRRPRALMPADRGRYPPPLWLSQARRLAADSSPPDRH